MHRQAIFVFGSMRDRELLEVVLGRRVAEPVYQAATLEGYRLGRVPDERYPLLVRDIDSRVAGEIVDGLSEEDLARVLFFEGDEYELQPCRVTVQGAGYRDVLFCDNFVHATETITASWSLSEWQRVDKPSFLQVAKRFMAFYGCGNREEAEAVWRALETNENNRSSAA